MNNNEFETKMRAMEYFHSLKAPIGAYIVVRVDGRSFSRFTKDRFAKPFDEKFRDHMIATCQALMAETDAIYAYTESDEISILFPKNWNMFDREIEKIVSVTAGIASAAFTKSCGELAHFDSRIWLGINQESVVDYFRWRQSDALRCALNGWCYWKLRESGKSKGEATSTLHKKSIEFKNELLFQMGINFNNVPVWQRRGIGLYWVEYSKIGHNPIIGENVSVTRHRLKINLELPTRNEYSEFIFMLLNPYLKQYDHPTSHLYE